MKGQRESLKRESLQRGTISSVATSADSTIQRFNDSTILISNRQRTRKIDTRFLRRIVSAVLAELKITEAELGLHLVGARKMTEVNWQFLRHEGSTDVITFDHSEKRKTESRKRGEIHGEMFICVDNALEQAKQFQTTWMAEMVRYAVHGILHLLGYDDLKPALRRTMKREENRLMRRVEQRFSLAQLARPAKIRR